MVRSLSEALGKHPEAFKDLYTHMVKAGEIGGVLDDVLLRIANTLESEDEIRRKIKAALTYPIAMLGISFLLLVVMIVFVVPVFEKMFKDMGATLPFLTKIVVTISHFMVSWKGALFV